MQRLELFCSRSLQNVGSSHKNAEKVNVEGMLFNFSNISLNTPSIYMSQTTQFLNYSPVLANYKVIVLNFLQILQQNLILQDSEAKLHH